MALQPTVTQYFASKKRPASDVLLKKNNSSKVLVLDSLLAPSTQVNNGHKIDQSAPKIIYAPIQNSRPSLSKSGQLNPSIKKSVKKAGSSSKSGVGLNGKKAAKTSHGTNQGDIRKTFLNFKNTVTNTGGDYTEPNSEEQGTGSKEMFPCTPTKTQQNVAFVKKSVLSPKRIMPTSSSEEQNEEISEKESNHISEKELDNESKDEEVNLKIAVESKSEKEVENQQIVSRTNLLRKELNLGQIKAKLTRSSRLEEMKQALERINQSKANLSNIQEKLKKPTLEKFESVELEVPYASPKKTPVKGILSFGSGSKFTPSRLFNEPPPPPPVASPLKSPFKSPAFQRYQTLVTEGRSALTLPFKYRALAEMFHCVDTVVSMFNNRKETVTFAKLKPAVEEMKKRALTEYQLGQIKTVFPQGFKFHQEKIHKFGSTMQSDKYDLVITPLLPNSDKDSAKPAVMTPTCILERKRAFYKTLLDMTKDYHEEFLTGLDPPMHISRDRLSRWHPNFDVDGVPDITSSALPQPPNVEKITTAKDVLERSRSLFAPNPRMQRALLKVSELNESSTPDTTSAKTLSTSTLLKGIPKCLLEKVRAKQAARAMEAMTRTPAQAKEAVRLTRLPEIARIIRNLFVAEKKSVLPRDLVLKKLDDSYRENLTISDLDDHVKLLSDHTPGWMAFCNIRKTDYIRLSKNADMLRIMRRLESLAAEKEF